MGFSHSGGSPSGFHSPSWNCHNTIACLLVCKFSLPLLSTVSFVVFSSVVMFSSTDPNRTSSTSSDMFGSIFSPTIKIVEVTAIRAKVNMMIILYFIRILGYYWIKINHLSRKNLDFFFSSSISCLLLSSILLSASILCIFCSWCLVHSS